MLNIRCTVRVMMKSSRTRADDTHTHTHILCRVYIVSPFNVEYNVSLFLMIFAIILTRHKEKLCKNNNNNHKIKEMLLSYDRTTHRKLPIPITEVVARATIPHNPSCTTSCFNRYLMAESSFSKCRFCRHTSLFKCFYFRSFSLIY